MFLCVYLYTKMYCIRELPHTEGELGPYINYISKEKWDLNISVMRVQSIVNGVQRIICILADCGVLPYISKRPVDDTLHQYVY